MSYFYTVSLAMHMKTSRVAYRRLPPPKFVCQLKVPTVSTHPRQAYGKAARTGRR
jgi:hypothetical protein